MHENIGATGSVLVVNWGCVVVGGNCKRTKHGMAVIVFWLGLWGITGFGGDIVCAYKERLLLLCCLVIG